MTFNKTPKKSGYYDNVTPIYIAIYIFIALFWVLLVSLCWILQVLPILALFIVVSVVVGYLGS